MIHAHVGVALGLGNDARDAGVKLVVLVEGDFEASLVAVDLGDVEVASSNSGGHDVDGGADFFWQFAVAIFEVGGDFSESEGVAGGHELFVEVKTLSWVFDIVGGDECLDGEVNAGKGFEASKGIFVAGGTASVGVGFEELYFGFDELAVEVVSNGVHLSGLLGTEEVTGTSDLEVSEGEGVAGSELVEFSEGLEAFSASFGEGLVAGVKEIGVGLAVGSPDTAPKLVELGEAELVGIFDDEGVGVGDIESGFDDGGADEDIDFALDESDHDRFEFFLVHLSVTDGDTGLGDEFLDFVRDVIDAINAVVDKEDLSASGEFSEDGFANDFVGFWTDEGAHRETTGWGVVDERHLSDVHEGHAEGARDGGGAHGENIYIDADGLEGFFVFDSELLFFVNDEESEIFEFELV